MAAADLDRVDAEQLSCNEPLEGRLEELIVGRIDQRGRDVRELGERIVVGRHRHRLQVPRQRLRRLRRKPRIHHRFRDLGIPGRRAVRERRRERETLAEDSRRVRQIVTAHPGQR